MTGLRAVQTSPRSSPSSHLIERTELLAWNAAEKGDSDVLPWMAEFRVLRGFSRELAEVAWAQEHPCTVETIQAPLSALTVRNVHLLDPISFLRFGGSAVALADQIEASRVPMNIATAVRWAPNRSRARIILPGSFDRWADGGMRIEQQFAYILELDLAAFFPSIRPEVLQRFLTRLDAKYGGMIVQEHLRLGLRGLPVGGVPARIVGEVLLDVIDRHLVRAGRTHVRKMDDMAVGVEDADDAVEVVRTIADTCEKLGLSINKAKTKLRPSRAKKVQEEPVEVARRLLHQDDPDRARLSRTLHDLREVLPGWEARKRTRWLHLLADAATNLPIGLSSILRTIEALLPGTNGLDQHVECLRALLRSRVALHRAEGAKFLSRHGAPVVPELVRLVVADRAALVRREALFGLVRLEGRDEVRGLLRGEPPTQLDRGAWIIAAGVLAVKTTLASDPYGRLLHQAAREHLPKDI